MSLVLAFSYIIAVLACDEIFDRDTEKHENFWLYNGFLFVFVLINNVANMFFLWIASYDARRRNHIMEGLTSALELDFHTKNSVSVRFPTINFLDPNSMITWLEARKLVLETGSRF